MRRHAEMEWPDAEFVRIRLGQRVLVLHRDLLAYAPALTGRLREIAAGHQSGEGNRGSGYRVFLGHGPELFIRRAQRGGLMRFFFSSTFFGENPRPFQELLIASEARRRGVALPQPMGAAVDWIAPGVYRGFFLTRALKGMTMWEFVRADDDPVVRAHVMLKARAAVATMHNAGVFHADLNLHNLMVTQAGESFVVMILDFDKARLYDHPLSAGLRHRNAQRLLRSARKLDPAGRYFDAAALKVLDVS